jgi:large subunit ribosomal protein L13
MRKEDVKRRWLHVDATDQILGRLAVKVARILMGKESPLFTPGVDTGDFVVVTGASAVKVSGRKEEGKLYRHHTGYIGHLIERPLGGLRAKKPEKLIELAVRRMLPKNQLGRAMLKRLKVYPGKDHPHAVQRPVTVQVPGKKGVWHVPAGAAVSGQAVSGRATGGSVRSGG